MAKRHLAWLTFLLALFGLGAAGLRLDADSRGGPSATLAATQAPSAVSDVNDDDDDSGTGDAQYDAILPRVSVAASVVPASHSAPHVPLLSGVLAVRAASGRAPPFRA